MSTRSRNALFALLTLAATLVVMAVAGEIAIRIWAPTDLRPDPYVIRSLIPNVRARVWGYETPENNAGLSTSIPDEPIEIGWSGTNNLGFRMTEDVGEKRPDEGRILLLGDSYVEAGQVDEADRFAEIVSKQLDEETGGRWKIINAGIRSGSPLQYLMQLHHWADELQPDLVIVFFGANDSPDDIRTRNRYGVVSDENGFPMHPQKQFSLAVVYSSRLMLYLTRLVFFGMPKLFALLSPDRVQTADADAGSVHSWIELACTASEPSRQVFLEGTGRYLRMLRDATARIGADFAAVHIHYPFYFPNEPSYKLTFPPDFWAAIEEHDCVRSEGRAYESFVRQFLSESQIRYASTYDRFMEAKRRDPKQKLWHFLDYHYNPVGHRLVADELHELIRAMIDERATLSKPAS